MILGILFIPASIFLGAVIGAVIGAVGMISIYEKKIIRGDRIKIDGRTYRAAAEDKQD